MESIPEDIKAIINEEVARVRTEELVKEDKKLRIEQERLERGKKRIDEWIASQVSRAPILLRPYYARLNTDRDIEQIYKDYGDENQNGLPSWELIYEVPGLAPLVFYVEKGQWGTAVADQDREYYLPTYQAYWNAVRRGESLSAVLAMAMKEAEKFQSFELAYEQRNQSLIIEHELEEKQEAESWKKSQEEKKQRVSEELQLFNMFKDDPVAVHLLKAFLYVRQERSMFDAQLEDANSTMYSIEDRYSRKAADLRRQAEDADHRAKEERNRVRDLEDDLSAAKKTIKQSQGW